MLRWIFLLITIFSLPVWAEPIELVLPNKLTAKAEYRKAEAGKPTVLLMHGFLQTHEFPTIHRLTEGLSGAGYGVLAPTLTLGVTHRKQSKACEAIHTYTMDEGSKELATWVNWLKANKTRTIVLMGHSFGSVELLAYLSTNHDPVVRKMIGVSAAEGRIKVDDKSRDKVIRQTRALVKAGSKNLLTQPFSFCQKFRATPKAMLSYLEWTPDHIIHQAGNLPISTTFIMGSRDDRLGPGWIEQLGKTKAKVSVIEGANHFMDGDFEFDLLDTVLLELKSL